jgi:hypothetical protein
MRKKENEGGKRSLRNASKGKFNRKNPLFGSVCEGMFFVNILCSG